MENEYRVYSVKTLKKANGMEAERLLKNIVAQVQPIMRKRQWKVMILKEFFPDNANLLVRSPSQLGGHLVFYCCMLKSMFMFNLL